MVDITVRPDDICMEVHEDETVLAALARAGMRYRFGCRRGGCGVCKVHLVLGEVHYERPIAESVLSDDERVEGICLSCRAVPMTNVVIELQEGDKLRKVMPYGFASRKAARPSWSGRPRQATAEQSLRKGTSR
jgi:CDP-4-dehydro-6-deoxyglucose reductase